MKKYIGVAVSGVILLGVWVNGFSNLSAEEITKESTTKSEAAITQPDEHTVLLFNFGPGEIKEGGATGSAVSDLSGNGNDGKFFNNSGMKWVEGRGGRGDRAIFFDNRSWNYLGLEKSNSLCSPKSGLTIELWIKLKDRSYKAEPKASNIVVFVSPDWNNGYALGFSECTEDEDNLRFHIGKGKEQRLWMKANVRKFLALDKWHHIAATWDGSNMRIYIDGKEVAEAADYLPNSGREITYEGIGGNEQLLYIGTRMNAALDEIRISNIARNYGEQGGK